MKNKSKVNFNFKKNYHYSLNFFMSFCIKVLGVILTLGSQIYLARVLSIKDYGYYNFGLTSLAIIGILSRFNIEILALKEITIYLNQKNLAKVKSFLNESIGIIFKLFLVIFLFLIIYIFLSESLTKNLKYVAIIFLLSIPFYNLSLLLSSFLRVYDFFISSQIFEAILKPIFIILFLSIFLFLSNNKFNFEIFELSVLYFFVSVVSFLIILVIFNQNIYSILKKIKPSYKENKILKKSTPIFFGTFFFLLISQSDILMLNILKGPESVGLYAPAAKLSSMIFFLGSIFSAVIATKISEAFLKKNVNEINRISKFTTKILLLISFIYLMFLFFFGKIFLSLFGENFVLSYIPLLILSFGYIARSFSISQDFMVMTNMQKNFLYILFLGFIINLAGNYVLIEKYGITGASVATSISLIFIYTLMPILIYTKHKINTTIFNI